MRVRVRVSLGAPLNMTVQELINRLQEFDPKLPVMLSGYEGGVYPGPNNFNTVTVALNVNSPEDWWYGPHDIVHDNSEYQGAEKITALYLT